MRTTTIIHAIMLLGALAACSGDTTTPERNGSNAGHSRLSASQRASVVRVLDSYESLRSTLAKDATSAVAKRATQLEAAAAEAAHSMPAHLSKNMSDLRAAAKQMKGLKLDDVVAMRKAFGDVSRPVVALLSTESSLRSGRFVFECPMAHGYKKWVQDSEEISNPYMGKAMPRCGKESDWMVGQR